MSKLRLQISMSLDGYVAGPNQSEENPLGEGGEQLHDWVVGFVCPCSQLNSDVGLTAPTRTSEWVRSLRLPSPRKKEQLR